MPDNPTHCAYSDESYQTKSRYRSVAVITLKVCDEPSITGTFQEIIKNHKISEFKWVKLRQDRDKSAALELVDKTIEFALQRRLRVDVLIWDTYDSRHQIPGRDDVANLQRMYYHLFKNVLQHRWPRESTWRLHPDENSALDWGTVQDCLDAASYEIRIEGGLLAGEFRMKLRQDFSVLQITEVCSTEAPLCQVADLFAGLGAFSYSSYDKYSTWLNQEQGQLPLFNSLDCQVSNRERERFAIMRHLDNRCKRYKLGVGLKSSKGFNTYNPRNQINFWLYEPQHPEDKAPTRRKSNHHNKKR